MADDDKVEILNRRLKKVVEHFRQLQKVGIGEELLIIYMHDRTKISKRDIRKMLHSQEEFYDSFIAKAVAEGV